MRKTVLFTLLIFTTMLSAQEVTLREKIGQMIMTGFTNEGESYEQILKDVSDNNLGGILYFAHNIDYASQIRDLSATLQNNANTPLFIAIDQEGGRVARFSDNNGYQDVPSAYYLGSVVNSEDSTRFYAALMASWLYDAGCNVDFAPVVDVNVNPESPAIGRYGRSYSDNPEIVYNHAGWFIDEFNEVNIATSLKHFPGHGSAADDSHFGFTDITDTWSETELVPFQMLIDHGYNDMIMAGHLYNGNIDTLYPASISKTFIDSLLRNEMHYNGVVVTDEMFMQAISNNFGFEEAVVLAVNSGTDILLYSTNMYEDMPLVPRIIDLIEEKVNDGVITAERIDEAYGRITELKERREIITSLETIAGNTIPEDYSLANYPNPFNPSTKITVEITEPGRAKLSVYDITGSLVKEIANGELTTGKHVFDFSGADLSSGIYLAVLETKGGIFTRKLMLVK